VSARSDADPRSESAIRAGPGPDGQRHDDNGETGSISRAARRSHIAACPQVIVVGRPGLQNRTPRSSNESGTWMNGNHWHTTVDGACVMSLQPLLLVSVNVGCSLACMPPSLVARSAYPRADILSSQSATTAEPSTRAYSALRHPRLYGLTTLLLLQGKKAH